jgi:hypothetical protein
MVPRGQEQQETWAAVASNVQDSQLHGQPSGSNKHRNDDNAGSLLQTDGLEGFEANTASNTLHLIIKRVKNRKVFDFHARYKKIPWPLKFEYGHSGAAI